MLNVGQGQPAHSLAQGDAQRCANSLGLDTMKGSTGQYSAGRGKVGTFVGHFVASSTYFNHVNLLRKHLLCFLHTITTTGNCRRRRLPQTKKGKGSGCSALSLSLSRSQRDCIGTNFNFNLSTASQCRPELCYTPSLPPFLAVKLPFTLP